MGLGSWHFAGPKGSAPKSDRASQGPLLRASAVPCPAACLHPPRAGQVLFPCLESWPASREAVACSLIQEHKEEQ